MKIAIARGEGCFGGIFRRFRELSMWCKGRHETVGLMPLGKDDGALDWPVRTLCYSRLRHIRPDLLRADSIESVLDACAALIGRIASDLRTESPDKVLAVDTDLKGLCVVAACRRAGLPVTTFVAGVSSEEAGRDRGRPPPFVALAERYCLEQSDRLIFPSLFVAEYCAAKHLGMAPFAVVHNGIADTFLRAGLATPDPRAIGAVMRLSWVKNPDALGRIADALHRRGYSLDLITDSGGNTRPSELKGLSNVRLVEPTLSDDALADFYGRRRAVVCPSRFEASGNVPMESIAVGTPAVVTDRMGIGEIFRSLGLGHLIVPVGDVEGAVERLVDAEPVPLPVRERIRAEFSWQAVCPRLVAAL
ncbi:MAG: glycosyltransferase family 4 protein [Proteobacteria bacterium]|nr:glycosyltransferase family 4 protein [Pseudomonadota bacterium]